MTSTRNPRHRTFTKTPQKLPRDAFKELKEMVGRYLRLGQAEAAWAVLDEVYRATGDGIWLINKALALPSFAMTEIEIKRSREHLEETLDQMTESVPIDQHGALFVPGLHILAYQGYDTRSIMETLGQIFSRYFGSIKLEPPQKVTKKRPRVGVVSRYFYSHSVMKCYQRLIESLDQSGFDTFLFQHGARHDEVTASLANHVTGLGYLPGCLKEAAEWVRASTCDLVIFPDIGMNLFTYYLGFFRLAPVQAALVGHGVTTGIPNLDYFLSSQFFEPEGAEVHYTETLVQLSDIGISYHQPPSVKPVKTRADFGFSASDTVYYCPQSILKFHPDFDHYLSDILEQDKQAVIVLLQPELEKQQLLNRWKKTVPINVDRVRIFPRLKNWDYLQLLMSADVCLDPIHYGGGVTAYESLYFGVPLVTIPGRFLRSRIAYGLYQALDMADTACIAVDQKTYVNQAVEIANNRTLNQEIRLELADQTNPFRQPNFGLDAMTEWMSTTIR